MRTFIKWSGNKTRLIKHLLPLIPNEYNTYIEPFIGSGALFLKEEPDKWIINDVNKDLINCWKQVLQNEQKIIEIFQDFGKKFKPMSKDRKLKYCRELLSKMEKLPFNLLRCGLFLLLKYCVYLGQIIRNGEFYFQGLDMKVLKNIYSFLNLSYYNNLKDIHEFLSETKGKIYSKDYKQILEKAKTNDFVFLDPPYYEPKKNYNFEYNKNEKVDLNFLKELLTEVKKLDKKKVKWIMTQAETKDVKELFKKYKIQKVKLYRITSKSYVNELIIKNY